MLYEIEDRVYLNLTNRCPTACRFCVKRDWNMLFAGLDFRLRREPETREVLKALDERLGRAPASEVVFCGYGDCAYRLDAVTAVGRYLRERHPGVRVRLNTVGLGNLIWGRDITSELARHLDEVSVSLNTADPKQWAELLRPARPYRRAGFAAARDFVARCVAAGLKTTVTAVELPGVDLGAVRALARELGAGFRIRPRLD